MNRNGQSPNGDESGEWGQPANGWGQPTNNGQWGQRSNDWGNAPATNTFPPVAPGQPGQPAPKKSRTGAIIGVIIGLLVIVAVAAAVLSWALGWFDRSGSSAQSTVIEVVTETAGAPAPDGQLGQQPTSGWGLGETQSPAEEEPEPEARPENPGLPATASPANAAASSGQPAGNFDNAYTGSSVTSAPFAAEVAAAFRAHFRDTGETNGVIEASSPVTGSSYTMNCRDNGSYVTCTGGNNAVVYIS